MVNSTVPADGAFDRLLDAMPRIAEAVNGFKSEDNQRVALAALVRAAGLAGEPTFHQEMTTEPSLTVVPPLAESRPDTTATDHMPSEPPLGRSAGTSASRQRRGRKPSGKKSWPRVKDVNFRPSGEQSLRDFVAEKAPASYHEKNLVVVWYLAKRLGITAIGVGHVLAAYDECEWKPSADPENSLQVTASLKNWLDTSDMKAIRTTHGGDNTIQYDMPIKKANKLA